MKSLLKIFMVLFLATVICLPGMALATSINSTGGFGAGTVTEGFEGIAPDTFNFFNGWFLIGTLPPYNFGTGVSLLAPPAINDGGNNVGAYIRDFTINLGGNADQVGSYGEIEAAPFDNAYLGVWREVAFNLTFKFDQDVVRAGAYFTGWPEDDISSPSIYEVRALDGSGNVLESYPISTINVSDWATNFVGIERLSGFRELDFASPPNGQIVLDNVEFQPVPLPPTALLVGSGLLGLVGLRMRRRPRATGK